MYLLPIGGNEQEVSTATSFAQAAVRDSRAGVVRWSGPGSSEELKNIYLLRCGKDKELSK
jgi:hypothetical protein